MGTAARCSGRARRLIVLCGAVSSGVTRNRRDLACEFDGPGTVPTTLCVPDHCRACHGRVATLRTRQPVRGRANVRQSKDSATSSPTSVGRCRSHLAIAALSLLCILVRL